MQVPGWDTPWGLCEARRAVSTPAIREASSPLTGCGSHICPWGQATAQLEGGDAWSSHVPREGCHASVLRSTRGSRGRLRCHPVPPRLTF